MKPVTAYQAQDGSIHKTEADAFSHETAISWRKKLAAFKESGLAPYDTTPQMVMMDKSIIAWETYKALSARNQESESK